MPDSKILTGEQLTLLTTAEAPGPPSDAPKPTEALRALPSEPFEVTLPNGVVVVLAKPEKPVLLHIAKVLGQDSFNPTLELYYKALMWVRQVNGMKMPFLAKKDAFDAVHILVGDDGLETIVMKTLPQVEATLDSEALKK